MPCWQQVPTVLPAGALKDLLFIGVLAHQAVDGDLLALPNPVAPCHCLQVILHNSTNEVLSELHAFCACDRKHNSKCQQLAASTHALT